MNPALPRRHLLAAAGTVLLLLAAGTRAQQPPVGRAIFFSEPGFRGEQLVVEAGGVVDNLEFVRDRRGRPFNNRISSVLFEGPVRVAVFEYSQFRGAFTWLDSDTPDLTTYSLDDRSADTWNETISSLQVEETQRGVDAFTPWERRDAVRAVRAAYRDYLGREPDSQGLRFYVGRLLDAGWSEAQLREELRRSPEFQQRDLDAIIRRAYREVLGREPDPSGLATYKRSLGRGMTEPELRAELARSREGMELQARENTRLARELVTRVYRDLLKRDPDPGGLDTYTRAILEKGWDERRLRDSIRKSNEFRRLHGG